MTNGRVEVITSVERWWLARIAAHPAHTLDDSCPGIGVHLKHASIRQPDLGRHLTRLHHHLRRRNARRGRGLAARAVDRHVPGRWPPIRRARQGRCRNRLHRGRHRELETDHRRHASRRPRASPKTFNRVSIPRCSPEAYTTITDRGYGFPGSWPSLGFGLAPE